MTSQVIELPRPSFSGLVASELRAEMARQGINQVALAKRMHVTQAWVSRRISAKGAPVDLTHEDTAAMAEALNLSIQRLYAAVLPRLDSNQQPSGYLSSLVRAVRRALRRRTDRRRLGPLAVVVEMDAHRLERAS